MDVWGGRTSLQGLSARDTSLWTVAPDVRAGGCECDFEVVVARSSFVLEILY